MGRLNVTETAAPNVKVTGAMPPVLRTLLPIVATVFLAYFVIGLAMPVLPLYVHHGLGLSPFIVGVVAGSQFAAALLTRLWAGHYVDTRGARRGVVVGLLVAGSSGLIYLLSLRFTDTPRVSVTILTLGRALLGGAESFIITGALSWALALLGPENTGKVMSWVGTALYAAFAVGAPAGAALYASYGFEAIALATLLVPLGTLLLVNAMHPVVLPQSDAPHERSTFLSVAGAVWMPGLGLAISGVGFAAVTTFVGLLFAQHGWGPVWLAFTIFSIAFVLGRVVFGHLPDRIG